MTYECLKTIILNYFHDKPKMFPDKVNVEEMTQESIMKSRDTSVDPKKVR